jgi:succinylarginine dihydrolase
MLMRPVLFDGLPGPTHAHAGLASGNLAATRHAGQVGNPKAAALEGLAKMRRVRALGGLQAVLPPHPRPDVDALRRIGFSGSDQDVLQAAATIDGGKLLSSVSSASAMWTANAATVAPSSDTRDGRVHIVPANLASMFHRSLEAPVTTRILRRVFGDEKRFVVHDPLPAPLADEGAANHIRLETDAGSFHVFCWGRASDVPGPKVHPARQTREASQALARLLQVSRFGAFQQDPSGIDGGAFHTDVLAFGSGSLVCLHERAFLHVDARVQELVQTLGPKLSVTIARESDVTLDEAVRSYVFNSELLELDSGRKILLVPKEAENSPARRFLDRIPVDGLELVDVNASMKNGGGPACLRLAIPLTDEERASLGGRVLLDDELEATLVKWVERHYRDRLLPDDLRDPALLEETRRALDELSGLLGLGSIYDFQS